MSKKATKPAENVPMHRSVEEFEALSDADKQKVWNYYDREVPRSETRPLNKREREQHKRMVRRSVGRPKIGQGAKVVAVTLERSFLDRVDHYARQHKMKRSQMIVRGLRRIMEEGSLPTVKTRNSAQR